MQYIGFDKDLNNGKLLEFYNEKKINGDLWKYKDDM